jgi:L-asparaginase II
MTGVPEMVAGPGRFTTRLMEVTGGRVLGKEGHEGFYGLAVRGPVALGVAVKIADGGGRCRDGVVLDLLRQMGCLSADELSRLAGFHRVEVHNRRGQTVGEVVPDLELEEVEEPGLAREWQREAREINA